MRKHQLTLYYLTFAFKKHANYEDDDQVIEAAMKWIFSQ